MRCVPAFVEQRIQPARSAAYLIGFRQAGEVNHARHPFAVVIKGRHRAVHETILILAFAYQQIELHFSTVKTDIQALKAVDPATQGIGKRKIRIELTGNIPRAGETDVPRQQCRIPFARHQFIETTHVTLTGLLFETVKNSEQLLRRHTLGFVHLVIEIVTETKLACKAVAQTNQFRETVVQQPLLQFTQSDLRTATIGFVFIVGLISQQLTERRINALTLGIDVGKAVLFAFGVQGSFSLNDFIEQRLRFRVFNRITVKETVPALQAVQQRFTAVVGSLFFQFSYQLTQFT